jgi:hypothetical protein
MDPLNFLDSLRKKSKSFNRQDAKVAKEEGREEEENKKKRESSLNKNFNNKNIF